MPSKIALDTGQLGGSVGARVNPNPPEPNPTHEADLGFPYAGPTPLARAPRRAAKGGRVGGGSPLCVDSSPIF